jgi:hypothetical protein
MKKAAAKKKVTVGRGMRESAAKVKAAKRKPGGSNVGQYARVAKKSFAGTAGGAPKGSYPINTKKRAESALRLAHNAPNPAGIRRAVYKKYPGLRPKGGKR